MFGNVQNAVMRKVLGCLMKHMLVKQLDWILRPKALLPIQNLGILPHLQISLILLHLGLTYFQDRPIELIVFRSVSSSGDDTQF